MFLAETKKTQFITKKMKKLLLASLMAFTAQAQAGRGFYSGNDFLATSEGSQLSYVMGVLDAKWEENDFFLMCMPNAVTGIQIHAVVKKYLADYPAERHFIASGIIRTALVKAFPCK